MFVVEQDLLRRDKRTSCVEPVERSKKTDIMQISLLLNAN